MNTSRESRRRTTLILLGFAATAAIGIASVSLESSARVDLATTPTASAAVRTTGDQQREPVRSMARAESSASNSAAPRGWYSAPTGTRSSFALNARIRTELHQAQQPPTIVPFEMRGVLEITVAARRGSELLAMTRFEDIEFRSEQSITDRDRTRHQAMSTALNQPFAMRITSSGSILGYRFPAAYDAFTRSQARNLLAQFQFVVADDAPTAWTGTERDESGEFETRYERIGDDGLEVRRTRLRCLASTASPDASMKIERSTARARRSAQAGWVVEASIDEQQMLTIPGVRLQTRSSIRGTWKLIHQERVAIAQPPAWNEPWSPAAGDPREFAAEALRVDAELWRERVAGMHATDLIADLERILASEQHGSDAWHQTWDMLVRILEFDAAQIAEAVATLERQSLTDTAALAVLTALGSAGTEAAQAALSKVHGAVRLPSRLREGAALAMAQVQRPTAELIGGLLGSIPTSGPLDGLSGSSLLVLGALSPRSSETVGERTATQHLLALESRLRRSGQEDAWLQALGNSATPIGANRAIEYLSDKRARVRAAAVAALRAMPTAAARAALIERATRDADPNVRVQAADSLRVQGTAAAKRALREVLLRDQSQHVRRAALLALAGQLDPPSRTAIRDLATNDQVQAIRRLARSILDQS